MKKVAYVSVQLDDDVPDYMEGIIRCGSVISQDEDGNELEDHQELIDNAEFRSRDELISHVASKLGVSKEIIGIDA